MKKFLLAALLVASPTMYLFAEYVQIKKGVVTLDKKPIGFIEEVKNEEGVKVFHVYDNDRKELFSFVNVRDHKNKLYYQTISMPNRERTADMPYRPLMNAFNTARAVTEQAVVAYKFYNNGSWDQEAMERFMEENAMSYPERDALSKQQIKENLQYAKQMQLAVLDNGKIMIADKQIGKIIVHSMSDQSIVRIFIDDVNGNSKFKGKPTDNSYFRFYNTDSTYSEEYASNPYDMKTMPGRAQYFNIVIADQAKKGYWTIEDGVTNTEKQQELFAKINIDRQNGTVTTTSGAVLEGPITMVFAKAPNNSNIASLDFVNKLTILAFNDKGKERFQTFKPKEIKGFQVGDRAFESVNVKPSLIPTTSFCEIIYQNDKAKIYNLYNEDGTASIVFKSNDLENGYLLNSVIKSDKASQLIFERCPSLKAFIQDNNLKNTEQDAIRIADAYCQP